MSAICLLWFTKNFFYFVPSSFSWQRFIIILVVASKLLLLLLFLPRNCSTFTKSKFKKIDSWNVSQQNKNVQKMWHKLWPRKLCQSVSQSVKGTNNKNWDKIYLLAYFTRKLKAEKKWSHPPPRRHVISLHILVV